MATVRKEDRADVGPKKHGDMLAGVNVLGDELVELNDRGQIVIPSNIRDLLSLGKNSRLQIRLTKTGTIELQKVVHIPVDFSLDFDGELRGRVKAAYEKMEKGQVGDSNKLKKQLRR
jgi:AbrB family looped-hinge helix DNA binding protein